ncbi:3509_t:CDS:1, partial [Racocetra persica]
SDNHSVNEQYDALQNGSNPFAGEQVAGNQVVGNQETSQFSNTIFSGSTFNKAVGPQ